jgi:hypothetical protein
VGSEHYRRHAGKCPQHGVPFTKAAGRIAADIIRYRAIDPPAAPTSTPNTTPEDGRVSRGEDALRSSSVAELLPARHPRAGEQPPSSFVVPRPARKKA